MFSKEGIKMDEVIYKQGHKLPARMIINTLENIGCIEIKNVDYAITDEDVKIEYVGYSGSIRPDFRCIFNKKDCAVEVGGITNDDNKDISKLHKLLDEFDYIIHLYSDKHKLLLHCIIYEKRIEYDARTLETLEEQRDIITELLIQNKINKKYKYPTR